MSVHVHISTAGAPPAGNRDVAAVERGVAFGEVAPLMSAPALGAGEGAGCDQAHQRMLVFGKPRKPGAVALQTAVAP